MNQINVAIVVNAISVVFGAKLKDKLKYLLFQCNIYSTTFISSQKNMKLTIKLLNIAIKLLEL